MTHIVISYMELVLKVGKNMQFGAVADIYMVKKEDENLINITCQSIFPNNMSDIIR